MSNMQEWKLGDGNKSYSYIVPMLGLKDSQFFGQSFPKANFMNAFVGDDSIGLTDNDNCILLLYRFSGKLDYISFENELREHPDFQSSYEPDKKHTMYVFNVPLKYQEEYEKIIAGKYSQLEEEYKKHILAFHGYNENHPVYQVLYKKEEAYERLEKEFNIKIDRTMEASSLFIREKEYYQEKYKIKEAISPESGFNNMKEELGDNINN